MTERVVVFEIGDLAGEVDDDWVLNLADILAGCAGSELAEKRRNGCAYSQSSSAPIN